MPQPQDENATYTRQLSRKIDAAYEAYRAGEPDGDAQLYEAFRAQARNICTYHLGPNYRTLEHDITHRAIMGLKKFRGGSRVSTWFYEVAQNEANRALRRLIQDRNRLVPLDADDEESQVEIEAKPINQDAALDLEKLQRELSTEQAEVLASLREGHSLAQVSRRMGTPLGTTRSRYRLAKLRAREKIRRR